MPPKDERQVIWDESTSTQNHQTAGGYNLA